MIQCEQCEFFRRGASGEVAFACDPFSTIKEPECLAKWQFMKITQMVAAYQSTLNYYHKLAPMQEKMFKVMEKEIDDINEGDKWKAQDDEGDTFDIPGDDWNEDKPRR